MELTYARDITAQQKNGDFVIVHEKGTVCDPCVTKNKWGYTVFVDDVAGDTCDFCSK